MWDFITDFADTAVTVPLAALMLLFLLAAGQRRSAIAWAVAILFSAGSIGLIKALLASCDHRVTVAGVASPSGHAAMGAAVYGSLAFIMAAGQRVPARLSLDTATTLFVVAVWVSRPILGAHNVIEVTVGAAVGVIAAVTFRLLARLPADLPVRWLGAAALFLIVLLHGWRWPTERAIQGTASYLHALSPWCG